jgi:hypothetical protein
VEDSSDRPRVLTRPSPAQRRTDPVGQLMSSAVELAPGTPAENMGPASSGASPGSAAVPLAIGLHKPGVWLEPVRYQSSPSSTPHKAYGSTVAADDASFSVRAGEIFGIGARMGRQCSPSQLENTCRPLGAVEHPAYSDSSSRLRPPPHRPHVHSYQGLNHEVLSSMPS